MEYPFKDLLPLDEVLEREGYYKDWTHLDPKVFYSLTQISEYIKSKGYGVDVRLLIAQLAEHFGLKTTQVVDLANLLQQKFTNLEGVTQSFTNNINSLVAQMEADKNAIIANVTEDSEVIDAREGFTNLGTRLDSIKTQSSFYINVKNLPAPHVSAKGDGITDDTSAIQNAIDLASQAGGGDVVIPNGDYSIETLFLKRGVRLVGQGVGQQQYSSNQSNLKVSKDMPAIVIGDYGEMVFDTIIQNLNIVGNKTGLSQNGIEFVGKNPAYSIIDRVYIFNTGGHGILGGHTGHVNNIKITNSFIEGCMLDGIHLTYKTGQINAIWIAENNIVGNKRGVVFSGNNVVVKNNTIQANIDAGISVSTADLISRTEEGMSEYTMSSIIEGNYFEKNGSAKPNASIIEVYHGYTESPTDTTYNKILRQLVISKNYMAETGSNYQSAIYVYDLKDTLAHLGNSSVVLEDNYSDPSVPLIKYNKDTALGAGSSIKQSITGSFTQSMIDSLPSTVSLIGISKSTKWTKLDLLNGWTEYASGISYSDKDGRTDIYFSITSGAIATGTVIAKLPVSLAPFRNVIVPLDCASEGAFKGQGLIVKTNGEICVYSKEPFISGQSYNGHTSYLRFN